MARYLYHYADPGVDLWCRSFYLWTCDDAHFNHRVRNDGSIVVCNNDNLFVFICLIFNYL